MNEPLHCRTGDLSRHDLSAIYSAKRSNQLVFSDSLVGLCLLVALLRIGSDWCLCVYLSGALVIEAVAIVKGVVVRGTRDDLNTPTGAWLVVLVPLLFSCPALHKSASALILISCSLASFTFHVFLAGVSPLATGCIVSVWFICAAIVRLPLCPLQLLATFIFLYLLSREIIRDFPASLSLWEANLIAQICFVFLVTRPSFVIPLICAYFVERYHVKVDRCGVKDVLIGLIWFWPLLAELVNWIPDNVDYDNCHPLDLVHDLITPINVLLIATVWLPLVVASVVVVVLFGEADGKKVPSDLRKVFHLLAGVVYATGIAVSPRLLAVASTAVLTTFLVLEWVRRRGPVNVSIVLNSTLEPFRDARDSGGLIFTPIALILGLSFPVWNLGSASSTLSAQRSITAPCQAWSGVITIALGDSVAALVGRRWGKMWWNWPGSHRTLLGSLASLVSQLTLWSLLAAFYEWPFGQGSLALIVGVFAEAYTEQIDNLAIPLLVMSLLPQQRT